MADTSCSHSQILVRLANSRPFDALRMAGAMLESDPSDMLSWYLASKCLYETGNRDDAAKNMKNVVGAMASTSRPIWAIMSAIEYGMWGNDESKLVEQVAELYCSSSKRLEEKEIEPPSLPSYSLEPWPGTMSDDEVVEKAKEQMAVTWGEAMTLKANRDPLPSLPLFSALNKDHFISLVRCFRYHSVRAGETVISEGEVGREMYVTAFGLVKVVRGANVEQSKPVVLAHLGPGAFFGEMAIVSSVPRAASVVAEVDSVLLRADKNELEKLASEVSAVADVLVVFCHARMLENLMRISPVLAPVPAGRRADLIARFGTDYYSKGEVIISEGKPGPGLFLLVSGTVSVIKDMDDKKALVARLGAGDLFGEISLLLQKPSTATVVADQNTAVLKLDHEEFHKVIDEFPQLLKGAYDIAFEREKRNNSILGQKAEQGDDLVLI